MSNGAVIFDYSEMEWADWWSSLSEIKQAVIVLIGLELLLLTIAFVLDLLATPVQGVTPSDPDIEIIIDVIAGLIGSLALLFGFLGVVSIAILLIYYQLTR